MKKVISWLDINFEPIIMTIMFYAITFLITLQVILRFVFKTGFSWGEEVSRFMFVWLMYFSISYATKCQRHIKVSYLVQQFNEKIQKSILILGDILFLVFTVFATTSSIKIIQSVAKFNDRAVTVNVSLNVVYCAGLVGFILIGIRVIQGIVWKIRNFSKPMDYFENFGGIYNGANDICLGNVKGWKKAEEVKEEKV